MYLIGAGGHSKVVHDILDSNNERVDGFVSRSVGEPHYKGIPIFNDVAFSQISSPTVIVAIGDNFARKNLVETHQWKYAKAVHRSALVSKSVSIGEGTVVMHGAIVQVEARIGAHVIVNTGAQVDHDCIIEDFVHLGPGSVLTGSVTVGMGTLVGANSTVTPGKKIGQWAVIGAGTVIIDDVPDYAMVVGSPGRIIKFLNQ